MSVACGYLLVEKPPIENNRPLPLFELHIQRLAKAARPHLDGMLFVRHGFRHTSRLLLRPAQLWHLVACAEGEETGCAVGNQLLPGVGDVEIAHRELTDAVLRGEGGFGLLHTQALWMEGEVGRLGVE